MLNYLFSPSVVFVVFHWWVVGWRSEEKRQGGETEPARPRSRERADTKRSAQFDLVFRCRGVEVSGNAIQTADEVVLLLGASKVNPNGQ